MTELEIIKHIGKHGSFSGMLGYEGRSGEYILGGVGRVEEDVVEELYKKGLIYPSQVVHGGCVQLYDLTKEGVEYYEKNL